MVPASVIHSLCFNCRQEPNECLCEFAQRLQKLFTKLEKRDPQGIRDVLLRDQFLDGLRDPILRPELRAQVLLHEEAVMRKEAYGHSEVSVYQCHVPCQQVGHVV